MMKLEQPETLTWFEKVDQGMAERLEHHRQVHADMTDETYRQRQVMVNVIGMLPTFGEMGLLTQNEIEQLVNKYNQLTNENVSLSDIEIMR